MLSQTAAVYHNDAEFVSRTDLKSRLASDA